MTALDDAVTIAARDAVRALLYQRYPEPLSAATVTTALGLSRPDLDADAIEGALRYLGEAAEARAEKRGGVVFIRLLPGGLVVHEAGLPPDQRAGAELLRLRVLMMLGLTPNKALSEGLLARMLAQETTLDISEAGIHRALTVLCDQDLAHWVDRALAIIQPRGLHLLSGTLTVPGVASPATI